MTMALVLRITDNDILWILMNVVYFYFLTWDICHVEKYCYKLISWLSMGNMGLKKVYISGDIHPKCI